MARRQRGAGDRRAGRQGQGRGPQRCGSGRQGRQAVSGGKGDREAEGTPFRSDGMGAGMVGIETRRRVTEMKIWSTMMLLERKSKRLKSSPEGEYWMLHYA